MADGWNRQELMDAILSYKALQNNPQLVKADEYRRLASKYPARGAKAFEYRMQNISYVLYLQGREWIQGLKPASHVGTNVVKQIEEILSEVENRAFNDEVVTRGIVEEKRKKSKVIAPPKGNKKPGKKRCATTQYSRDPNVIAWVLNAANGKCESCRSDAPFTGIDGLPFLEVHHVKHLADGGSDTVTNSVALCPNCHRELHYGMNGVDRKKNLYDTVSRLKVE